MVWLNKLELESVLCSENVYVVFLSQTLLQNKKPVISISNKVLGAFKTRCASRRLILPPPPLPSQNETWLLLLYFTFFSMYSLLLLNTKLSLSYVLYISSKKFSCIVHRAATGGRRVLVLVKEKQNTKFLNTRLIPIKV